MSKVGVREIVYSLHSPVCPACGNDKNRRHSFCKPCFFRIRDPLMRDALCARFGNGYERAFRDAMRALSCEYLCVIIEERKD